MTREEIQKVREALSLSSRHLNRLSSFMSDRERPVALKAVKEAQAIMENEEESGTGSFWDRVG